jgi:RHS repeat-associated protein
VTVNQGAQDHTAAPAYQLSGTATAGGAPLAGVAFTATNGGACTASNASGQYSCTVLQGWSGRVTPSYNGYAFTPVSRDYSGVAANQSAQDYAAVPAFTLSGTVAAGASPTAGVTFTATSGGTCTASNASGQYSCNVPQGWSGSVTPSLLGYGFTPASRAYSNLANSQAAQDFAAANVGATTVYYIHPDHLNTPRLIANQAGTTVWRWDQGEPFGNDVPNNNPSGAGAFDFPLRFPGQYFDGETNLAYNLRRDYDPNIGRYIESDPIGLAGGSNTYAYVESKPLYATDMEGLLAEICCRPVNNVLVGGILRMRHCYIKVDGATTYGLYPYPSESSRSPLGYPRLNDLRDQGGNCKRCGPPCSDPKECIEQADKNYPIGHWSLYGPNSNTYVGTIAKQCCGGIPSGLGNTPGINDNPPPSVQVTIGSRG